MSLTGDYTQSPFQPRSMSVMAIYGQSVACSTVQLHDMPSFNRPVIAVCAWEACVIGYFLAVLALIGGHIWSIDDLVWIAKLAVCGLFVVGAVALLSRRFGKAGGAITGALCGLVPSALMLTWVLVARPGFEASAGGAGIAFMLAAPSAVGGAFAGIICSRRKRASATS
jgi:hypothetical protein